MKIVGYFRVSTKKQGNRRRNGVTLEETIGLGLKAQRADVRAFADRNGGTIIAEYIEIESGKKATNRPKLKEALGHAKLAKAKLVIAKLDRLARNVAFTATLMETGVEFIACDNATANNMTIHMISAMAEAETVAISRRTKDALAQAKLEGVLLGSARPDHWKGREHLRGSKAGAKASAIARSQRAHTVYEFLLPTMLELLADGSTYGEIASALNEMGHTTVNGALFNATTVWRIVRRAEKVSA